VGTTSGAKTVTGANVGSTVVKFTGNGIVIAGADPTDFFDIGRYLRAQPREQGKLHSKH
jgi:hypothetical protein